MRRRADCSQEALRELRKPPFVPTDRRSLAPSPHKETSAFLRPPGGMRLVALDSELQLSAAEV